MLLVACSGARPGPPKNLPAPITKTALSQGDKLEIEVVGEKDLPKDYVVDSDGNLPFPFIPPILVNGLEPQEAKEKLRLSLIERKVWANPQLNVRVKEYAGKTVIISGQVAKPGSVPWHQTLGIVEALSQSGWFTPLGDANHVILTRTTTSGRTVTVVVSVEAITEGQQPDILLQAGDRIKVQASVM
jgi:protein involved in polysaccharide export with SLBB domain